MMLVFTVIYEQIMVEKMDTIITGRMTGTIANLKSNLLKYEALETDSKKVSLTQQKASAQGDEQLDKNELWKSSRENIMHNIVQNMSQLSLYLGDIDVYGKSALFTDKKEIIAKSGIILSAVEDIPQGEVYLMKYRDLYLEDYLTPKEIAALAQLQQLSMYAIDEINVGDNYKEYEINLTGYIQGNTVLPEKMELIEVTNKLTTKKVEPMKNGLQGVSSSSEQIDTKVVKTYQFRNQDVKGLVKKEFTRCSMAPTSFLYNKGGTYEDYTNVTKNDIHELTEELLKKLSLNNVVENPKELNRLGKDKFVIDERSGIWKRDAFTILPFQLDKKTYYLAYKTYYYPWPGAMKTLIPVYFFSLILVLAIGFILSQRLYRLYEKQEALELNRRRLTDAIAHELKTPLALISAYSEGLKANINDKKDHYIDIIIDETQKMDQMIVEMLLLSKLENGVVPLHFETVMMKEFILNEMKKYEKLLEDKGIDFAMEEVQPCKIKCDREHMKKVMNNLISNAIYYCTEGGKVIITLSENQIEIFNSGDQIPEEKLTKVWDSFYKVDDSRNKERNNGTGLGLAIVKNILELHELQYGIKNVEGGIIVWFAKK